MKGNELDLFLSIGYFRMQQELFTCQYIVFQDKLCPVHWLRISLAEVSYGSKQSRLFRINETFSVAVKPFLLTQDMEALYALYKKSVDFDAPDSVEFWLFNGATTSAFDTSVIELRDGNRLSLLLGYSITPRRVLRVS